MVYEERNVWTGLLVSIIAITTYVVLIVQRAESVPVVEIDWFPLMLWTIGLSIGATIIASIVWGVIAHAGDPEATGRSDIRDRDISRMGARVEQAFVVVAGLGVILLCAIGAEAFWIAHTMFAGFAVSAVVGSIARVVAYRRGLV